MIEKNVPFHARDKLALLLTLVPYLIDHDRVSVDETAQHFGVDARMIRDAVRLIAISGIPGETNTYQPGDLFDISWDDFEERDEIVLTHQVAIDDSPRFSGREAAALIAGLNYVSAIPDNADREVISSLMLKLARGASAVPIPVVVNPSTGDKTVATLREAVSSGVQVEFDYLSSRGTDERRSVDPLRLESLDHNWYLRGWDHLRDGLRTFRVDRIRDLAISEVSVRSRPTDHALSERLFESSHDDLTVTLEVAATTLPLIRDYLDEAAPVEEINGTIRTTIRVAHFHGLKRIVSSLAGLVTVIAPDQARETVAEWARSGLQQYETET